MIVPLSRETIDGAFEGARHQAEVLLALFRAVVPDFGRVVRMGGYVRCNEKTWLHVCERFIAFDKAHHRGAMPGGLWLDRGFGSAPDVPDWTARLPEGTAYQSQESGVRGQESGVSE